MSKRQSDSATPAQDMRFSQRPKRRCPWCGDDPLYQAYHDEEWGVPLTDPDRLFELLMLEGMQAGLTWRLILQRRSELRRAFWQFDPRRLASGKSAMAEQILQHPGVIRHRGKIDAVLGNARAFVKLSDQMPFDKFLWSFVGGTPIHNRFVSAQEVPAKTEQSLRMAKGLAAAGFKFVGPTICYAFMQASGMVNDHLQDCFRYAEIVGGQ